MVVYAVPFDPASRKTVSCNELDVAFKENPHPDGKAMQAFADKLGLNKKQVSNYFERERRKAGISIPSRRLNDTPGREAATVSSAHFGTTNTQSSDRHTSHTAADTNSRSGHAGINARQAQHGSTPSYSAGHPFATYQPSRYQAIRLPGLSTGAGNPPITSAANSVLLPTTTRPPKRVTSLKPTIVEHDKDCSSEPEQHDGDGDEYNDEADADADYDVRQDLEEEKAFIAQSQSLRHNVGHSALNASSATSTSAAVPSQRIYRDWSPEDAAWVPAYRPKSRLSPRYASGTPVDTSQQDHFAMACSAPTISLGSSSSPPLGSDADIRRPPYSSSNGLRAGFSYTASTSLRAPDLTYACSSSVVSSSPRALRRDATVGPSSSFDSSSTSYFTSPPGGIGSVHGESRKKSKKGPSPTLLFLQNPFPQPLPLSALCNEQAPSSGITQHDEPVRKRARVYFTRPSSSPKLSADDSGYAVHGHAGEKFEKIKHFATAAARTNAQSSPSSSDLVGGLDGGPMTRTAAAAAYTSTITGRDPFDDDEEEEEESDYDEDEDHAALKRKRAQQAALRTTIACDELKQAFLSNPHPPTHVLDQLAIKLGLGKKQVSNYFVRERKKTGYQIKVRHGLQRRKGKKKSTVDAHGNVIEAPRRPVAHSYNSYLSVAHPDYDDESLMDVEEDEFDNDRHYIAPTKRKSVAKPSVSRNAYPAIIVDNASDDGRDDVPELSYDDVASLLSEQMTHTDSTSSSLLMLATNSQDGPKTIAAPPSSTGDEDPEELASPPYPVTALAPQPFELPKPMQRSYQTLQPRIA